MDGPRDYHSKWSQSDRETQISYGIIYTRNQKYDTNEPISETEIESLDIENRLMVAQRYGFGGEMEWEAGDSSGSFNTQDG